MSQQAIETILGRAVLEGEFRSALLSDPDSALAGYDLTAAESATLAAMGVETLGVFAGALDQRISKSLAIGTMREDGITVVRPGDPYHPLMPRPHSFPPLMHLAEGF